MLSMLLLIFNNISSENISNQLKKYLIFHTIKKNCNNILKIYNLFRTKKKSKFFSEWKNKILIEKAKLKIENEIKEKYNKLYKNQISNISSGIKKNEKAKTKTKTATKTKTLKLDEIKKALEEDKKNISAKKKK